MSLTLKKNDEINLFSSVIYHVSFCAFFVLSVVCYVALAINLTVYIVGNTLSTFTKQFIMVASERSSIIARWCLVLIDEFISLTIDYIDLNEGQDQKISSEKNSIKTILANASKRKSRSRNLSVSLPVKKSLTAPVTSIEKTDAVQPIEVIPVKSVTNKPTEVFSALSKFSELSLRKAEKDKLPLEQRYRSSIPSSLGQDRSSDWKSSATLRTNKRYSTPASEKPKRSTSMKLINSTAANRVMLRSKAKRQDDGDMKCQQKSVPKQKPKPELKDKNINLFEDRPSLSQPPRTVYLNKTPATALQAARKCLKVMMNVRKHRKTI